jgi:hypothetical protein
MQRSRAPSRALGFVNRLLMRSCRKGFVVRPGLRALDSLVRAP